MALKRDLLLAHLRRTDGVFWLEDATSAVYGAVNRGTLVRCRTLLHDTVRSRGLVVCGPLVTHRGLALYVEVL